MPRTSILFFLLYCCVPATYGVLEESNYLSTWRVRSIAQTPTQRIPSNPYHPSHRDAEHISNLSTLHTYIGKDPTNNFIMLEHEAAYSVQLIDGDNPISIANSIIQHPNSVIDLQTLRNKLSIDACEIVNALPRQNQLHTTIVCVALKNQENQIKRFAFHNGDMGWLDQAYNTAHEKHYHVIQAERAHAEGQFLQYLFQNANEYTHIVGIGCSRAYCTECDCLLKLLLDPNWKYIATAAKTEALGVTLLDPQDLVSHQYCRQYKLPAILRKLIQVVVGKRLHFGVEGGVRLQEGRF